MPLTVSSASANPNTIPQAGGNVRVTFSANTLGGASRLQADYRLDPGSPYTLVGSTHLGPEAVALSPRPYPKDLTLRHDGTAIAPFVLIHVGIREILPSGNLGDEIPRSCIVTIQDFGGMLVAFREEQNLSQREVAERVGLSRSTISRIERGGGFSGTTAQRLVLRREA